MNEKQKIELGDFITDEVAKYLKPGCKLYFPLLDAGFLKIAELTLSKIHELTQDPDKTTDPVEEVVRCGCHTLLYTEIGYNAHICGVCYQTYCSECLTADFDRCETCKNLGLRSKVTEDKNGVSFTTGDTLRNESSLTTSVKVLQINETHIVSDPGGCVEIQDFIDAGWIVHDRVMKYKNGQMSGLTESCKFKTEHGTKIGSSWCTDECGNCKKINTGQNWVICELYNKEDEE